MTDAKKHTPSGKGEDVDILFLPFIKIHGDMIVQGIKTQTSRETIDPRIKPGAVIRVEVPNFADVEVVALHRRKLGDYDDEDARREGGYTLKEFKEVYKGRHGRWDDNVDVYTIQFKCVKQY